MNVMHSLPILLEADQETCLKEIVPRVQQSLPDADSEVHLVATNSFLTVLKKDLVPQTTFTQTFLQSILTSIDNKDPVVANAWLETLLDVIDLLPSDVVRQEVLNVAVVKGQLSQPVVSRLACCKLIGKISTKFESFLIQKEILPVVQSLCQDVNYEVRACMCHQLDSVARGLGPELTKSSILQMLVELSNDEEDYVRIAAAETVVTLLGGLLDEETCSETIVPLLKKLCENSLKSEDLVMVVIAKELGKLACGLSEHFSALEKEWLVDFYKKLAKLGLSHTQQESLRPDIPPMPDLVPVVDNADRHAECRHYCAFNFPAMLLYAVPVPQFEEQFYSTFHDLVCDPYFYVRRTMAAGFHEVVQILGPKMYLVRRDLVRLLNDTNVEVLEGLIPQLSLTFETLASDGGFSDAGVSFIVDLCDALLHCESEISQTYNWRLHALILEKMALVPKCFSSDFVHEKFIAAFRHKVLTLRPLPCRLAAAKTLLVLMRHTRRIRHKEEIYGFLREELCRGRSCRARMLFLEICIMIMDMFSKQFFKQKFFNNVLELTSDPVPNIRLKVSSMMPRMKTCLKLPTDNKLLQHLESCIRKSMMNEKDRDVSSAVRAAIVEMDAVEVSLESQFPTALDAPDDLDDQHKLEEEMQLSGVDDAEGHQISMRGREEYKTRDKGAEKTQRRRSIQASIREPLSLSSMRKAHVGSSVTMPNINIGSPLGESSASIKSSLVKKPGSYTNASVASKTISSTKFNNSSSSLNKSGLKSSVSLKRLPDAGKPDSMGKGLSSQVKLQNLNLKSSETQSVHNVDPTTDEFYVDAGVRIYSAPPPVSVIRTYVHESTIPKPTVARTQQIKKPDETPPHQSAVNVRSYTPRYSSLNRNSLSFELPDRSYNDSASLQRIFSKSSVPLRTSNIPRSVRSSKTASFHSSPGSTSPVLDRSRWQPRTVQSLNSSPVHSRSTSPSRDTDYWGLRGSNLKLSRLPRSTNSIGVSRSSPCSRSTSPTRISYNIKSSLHISDRPGTPVHSSNLTGSRLPTRTPYRKKTVNSKK